MVKKKFYKRWWIWVIAVIVAIGVAGAGNSASKDATQNNDNNIKVENNSDSKSNNNKFEKVKDVKTRDNSSAKETTLQTGTFIVGEDIPQGRYVCTGDSSGNFVVMDKNGLPVVNEILGSDELGVSKVTANLKDGEEIKISGIKNVKFIPAKTKLSNELGAGTWEVGLDIEPGKYIAEVSEGQGNFVVYNNGFPEVNEILDASGNMGVTNVTLNLKDSEEINISGLNKVKFNKK